MQLNASATKIMSIGFETPNSGSAKSRPRKYLYFGLNTIEKFGILVVILGSTITSIPQRTFKSLALWVQALVMPKLTDECDVKPSVVPPISATWI